MIVPARLKPGTDEWSRFFYPTPTHENITACVSKYSESTVLGAIFMAMISLKLVTLNDIKTMTESETLYSPKMTESERKKNYQGWENAIKKI